MSHLSSGGAAIVLGVLGLWQGVCAACEAAPKPKPLIAAVWLEVGASGAREVVIEPDTEKLQAAGLRIDQVAEAVKGRRFVSGKWTIRVEKTEYDLAALAKLTERDLRALPFTVKLADGREVVITPDPKRIGRYVVTGEYFEEDVRNALANSPGTDPAKVNVLGMIPVPGTVIPHLTEKDTMRHFSVGEPLETFAKVTLSDKPKRVERDAPTPPAR